MAKISHYRNVQIRAFGDWNRAQEFIQNLSPALRASALWGQEKAVKKLVKIVKDHIQQGTVPPGVTWQPLSEKTTKRKGHDKFYLDTKDYFRTIGTWRENYTFYAGVKRGFNNRNGIEISKLALILEKGVEGRIPPRPLWGPSLEQLGGLQEMRAIVLRAIENKLNQTAAPEWQIKRLNKMFR